MVCAWLLGIALYAPGAAAAELGPREATAVPPRTEVVLRWGVPPAQALQRARADTGLPAEELEGYTIEELIEGRGPLLVGEGELEACEAVPTDLDVVDRYVRLAETRLLYLDYDGVDEAIVSARAAILCLRDPLDPALVARMWFLAGIAAWDRHDETAAAAAFTRAHAMRPGTPWDADFPPGPRPLYEATATSSRATAPVALRVVPLPPGFQLRVDGRVEPPLGTSVLVEVAVSPGAHLLQVVGGSVVRTVRVELSTTAATVVLPSLLPDEAPAWAPEPRLAPQLDAVLGALLPVGSGVTVVLSESTWRRIPGQAWTRIARHAPALSRRSPVNALVTGAGATLGLGGAALGIAGWIQGSAAAADGAEATTWSEHTVHLRDYERARTQIVVGEALAGLGAGAFTIGLAVPLGPFPERSVVALGAASRRPALQGRAPPVAP